MKGDTARKSREERKDYRIVVSITTGQQRANSTVCRGVERCRESCAVQSVVGSGER